MFVKHFFIIFIFFLDTNNSSLYILYLLHNSVWR